jgi:hypothetical protein
MVGSSTLTWQVTLKVISAGGIAVTIDELDIVNAGDVTVELSGLGALDFLLNAVS